MEWYFILQRAGASVYVQAQDSEATVQTDSWKQVSHSPTSVNVALSSM